MLSNVISLAVCVMSIIGLWKVFEKAGVEGWKAIIPFYSTWVEANIATKNRTYAIGVLASQIAASVIAIICVFMAIGTTSFYTVNDTASDALAMTMLSGMGAFVILIFIAGIVNFIFSIFIAIRLAKAFGKDGGFAVGLILLNVIFICILGFDESEYLGPQD